jgi:hypothetical protein
MFYKKVFRPLTVLAAFKYIFLIIGIALLVTVVGLVIYKRYQARPTDTNVAPVEPRDETTPLLA